MDDLASTLTDRPDGTTRRGYLQSTGIVGVTALAGLGPLRSRPKQIVLGGSMSLSGPLADLGRLYQDAYRLTVRRINRAGGVEAGDGRTYRLGLLLRNDRSDPDNSAAIYRNLVDHRGIDYLLGPYSSSITLAASEVADDAMRPMVQGSGASPEIFEMGNEWLFGLLPTADRYPVSTIEMAMAQADPPSSAALLTEADTFSESSAEGAREALATASVPVLVDATFPSETTDLSELVTAVGNSGADLLILSAHEVHAILLANELAAQAVRPKLVMATVGSLTATFEAQTGANGDYVFGPSPWNDTADYEDPVYGSTTGFVEAIEDTYRYRPDYHSAAGAAVVETFREAFQTVDEIHPTSVRDAIRDASFTTAYGDIAFGNEGVIDRAMLVYQWQSIAGGGSVPVLVWPEAVQQAPPIYPTPA